LPAAVAVDQDLAEVVVLVDSLKETQPRYQLVQFIHLQ
jgi:hypothetical protein